MNLLLTINRRYLGITYTCLHSLLRFPTRESWDIYILESDLTDEDFAELRLEFPGTGFHRVAVDEALFADYPESKNYPKQMYYRILAARLLPPELERILYIDPDTIILHSLEPLYDMPFDGCYYIACTHTGKALTKANQVRLGSEEPTPYINSGVMMLNLTALRENQSEREIIDYVREYGRRFILPDQDIISALYGEHIKLVDHMIYNLSDRMLNLYNADLANEKRGLRWVCENTAVVHYCGKNKPWEDGYVGLLGVFYWEVAEFYKKIGR